VGFQAHGRNALNKTRASALEAPQPLPALPTWPAQKKLTKKFPKSLHAQAPVERFLPFAEPRQIIAHLLFKIRIRQ